MIKALRHVGIVVQDIEKAQKFWCDVLDFKVLRRLEEKGPYIDAMMGLDNVTVTTLKLCAIDGSIIELLHFSSHDDEPIWSGNPFSTGITHVAFTVSNIDKMLVKLLSNGVKAPSEPQISPDGKVRVIYVTLPDGVILELVEEAQ